MDTLRNIRGDTWIQGLLMEDFPRIPHGDTVWALQGPDRDLPFIWVVLKTMGPILLWMLSWHLIRYKNGTLILGTTLDP